MAAIVCRGLQSHLESQIVESRTLRLRLPSSTKPLPPPLPPQPIDFSFKSCFWDSNVKTQYQNHQEEEENKKIGWSFLEAISQGTNKRATEKDEKEEAIYVHPQQKRSSMVLSPKSLELCTENLGNESGTDIGENGIDDVISSGSGGGNLETGEQQQRQYEASRQCCTAMKNKKAKTANFPPPLTTMRGSESLLLRPHREDGRLVIEVTKVPPTPSCFQAQRSHGRLRLSLLKIHNPSFDPQHKHENEPTTNEEEEEEEEETEDEEEEEEEEEYFACEEKRIIEMPRTCKEGCEHENHNNNESLLMLTNWSEPFWVATS
ncbi:protein FANTASTIC FOUR 3-like [Arachis hypogaea]|uniref:protein FANTASTIC FOUR 3-like n=1 Tax=Arachis hypogaea TaxID=3818 RepID=UPI000DECE78D|nr:protein FANTASTIC FOUR 3-like [Arachis hypogaea]